MKKVLFLISTVCLVECAASVDAPTLNQVHKEYAQEIKTQLNASDWCYTYRNVENRNNAQILDFYVFEPTKSYSQWLCSKENDEIQCIMIFINWTN